jgi:hypothetical protein
MPHRKQGLLSTKVFHLQRNCSQTILYIRGMHMWWHHLPHECTKWNFFCPTLKLCRSSKKKADSSRRPQFQKSCITVSAYHSSSSWQVGNEMLSCAAAACAPGPPNPGTFRIRGKTNQNQRKTCIKESSNVCVRLQQSADQAGTM